MPPRKRKPLAVADDQSQPDDHESERDSNDKVPLDRGIVGQDVDVHSEEALRTRLSNGVSGFIRGCRTYRHGDEREENECDPGDVADFLRVVLGSLRVPGADDIVHLWKFVSSDFISFRHTAT